MKAYNGSRGVKEGKVKVKFTLEQAMKAKGGSSKSNKEM
jgi:hypothetical protein